jgi:hypothetical protein
MGSAGANSFPGSRRAAALAASLCLCAAPAMAQPLELIQSIELPSVRGRLDHLALDADNERLFIAALEVDTVEVVDLRSGRRSARIPVGREPQGVAYSSSTRHLFVASGAGGAVQAFADAKAPAASTASDLDDADNLRLDPSGRELYVGYASALAVLDPRTLHVVRRVALSGHPEAFELESKGRAVYVNVPSAGHIAVVDPVAGKVMATWKVAGASRNFPMALDEANHRLFIAARQPPLLIVYDTATGKRTAEAAVCGDADDLFFDGPRQQLYLVCGEGVVQVLRAQDGAHVEIVDRVATSPGARTGLFVPARSMLFVASPSRGTSAAQLRVYRVR